MSFRILFWNIEKFRGDNPVRAQTVIDHIRASSPEIVGFSEIQDKVALRSILQDSLSDYDFGITDGLQQIELLAGWKRGVFEQALFTQRREFKAKNPHLRPGSLLSVKKAGKFYNVLFLHTDSGTQDKDYTNRQDMFEKIWSLKDRLTAIEQATTRFIVLGDLNTMGKQARGNSPKISGEDEIRDLGQDASRNGMTLVGKSQPNTWAEVRPDGSIKRQSDLDHVLVSDNLQLADLDSGTKVDVRGWVDATSDAERHICVEEISDHCSIECLVELGTA